MNRKIVLEIELDDRIPSGVDEHAVRRAIYGLRGVRSVVELGVARPRQGEHYTAETVTITPMEDTRMGPR